MLPVRPAATPWGTDRGEPQALVRGTCLNCQVHPWSTACSTAPTWPFRFPFPFPASTSSPAALAPAICCGSGLPMCLGAGPLGCGHVVRMTHVGVGRCGRAALPRWDLRAQLLLRSALIQRVCELCVREGHGAQGRAVRGEEQQGRPLAATGVRRGPLWRPKLSRRTQCALVCLCTLRPQPRFCKLGWGQDVFAWLACPRAVGCARSRRALPGAAQSVFASS